MPTGPPVENRQQIILLSSEIAVIKIEAYSKETEPEYQENALTDFHAKAAAKNLRRL